VYPRNAASPERISIGPVVQISDGAVQTAGVTVRVLPFGGSEADGVGTVAYSTDGVVVYTPTQAETNYTSFVLIAKKTGCIPANVTVVTSESTVSGRVYVATNGDKTGYTAAVSDKTGFSLTPTTGLGNQAANITGNLSGSVGSVTGAVGSVASYGTLVSDVATAVWGAGARTLTGFGTLVSDVATAVWGAASRTLTAFGFNVSLTPGSGMGNQSGTVGGISGVTFPTNFANLDITIGGGIAQLGSNALAQNDLYTPIAQAVWGQLTTATWATDSFGQRVLVSKSTNRGVTVVGAESGHIASVVHGLEAGVITSTAFSANWLTAAGLAADAATEIATAVAATQALSRLDSMIESDGGGQFRFDTIALSMAPAGGGGGGTDWTANERTAIRTILGVPTSGTTPTDPTSGILDTIRDSLPGTQTINVYPVSASTPERVSGTTITYYRNEIRSVSVVTDFTLTNLTLSLTIEDAEGTDLLTIPNGSISRSSQTFTVSIGTAVTSSVGNKRWALRDLTGGTNSVIARGVFSVQEAASA
jgi:hypothetical protein